MNFCQFKSGVLLFFALLMPASAALADGTPHSGASIALFGSPKYRDGFDHFDYVDPNAPKGGTVKQAALGSYDSLNSFSIRGIPPFITPSLIYDTLMMASGDEPFSQYGLLAEKITYPDDCAWVEYKLRSNAHWQDGKPITVEDVVFSFETLTKSGSQFARSNVTDVAKVEARPGNVVRFTFKQAGNKVSLLNAGLMPILPKHYWQGKDFSAPSPTPPVLSGPYKISAFDIGRSITLKRDPNYWGRDINVNRGRYNFDTMVYDFYRDGTIAFEAFKAGQEDIRYEASQKNWATGYVWPAAKQGFVKRQAFTVDGGFLLRAFFFNLRNPKFQDIRVREALSDAFDFTWINKNYYYDFYVRSESYFGPNNRAAASTGLPSAGELALLTPYKGKVPPRVFTSKVHLPDTDGTQEALRQRLSTAMALLKQAGYTTKNGQLIDPQGKPFEFELLVSLPEFQLAAQNWVNNLKLLGINVTLRMIDNSAYIERLRRFDYDAVVAAMGQVGPPGVEQRNRWGSASASAQGSFNWAGIKDPAVDAMIDKVVAAKDQQSYLDALHALDRVLVWNFYTVPLFNGGNKYPLAWWDRFGMTATYAPFDQGYVTYWWIDPKKDAALRAAMHWD